MKDKKHVLGLIWGLLTEIEYGCFDNPKLHRTLVTKLGAYLDILDEEDVTQGLIDLLGKLGLDYLG